ncbi:MAG: glycerol-3-phosphate dehydrogenase/oxidase [Micrococcales bacterium]|nr:glycerol-3-phosphate dehydrogenase/oxidase [Micrococcales bacterium]
MNSSALTLDSRRRAIEAMTSQQGVDILVIGGGITGAGIALDAQARGYSTAIVEAQDWASGTSSRSSRLAHGGLRYLLMFDFKLVHEALTERDRLLSITAPHLVRPAPFLYPLAHRLWERPYVTAGVGLYDLLAHAPGRKRALPFQKHYLAKGLRQVFPDLNPRAGIGAVCYYDAQVDDARLTLTLVRTAAQLGAQAASRCQVTAITKNGHGVVDGADIVDLEFSRKHHVKARHVIAATGVWTEQTEAFCQAEGGLRVLASKGVHLVVPRDRINGRMGLITQTEKSVLFIIPWDTHWLIGTTDTPWQNELTHPVATQRDVDYLLQHANAVLTKTLTRDDVIGVFAGLRPLLQPGTKAGTSSAKISREHTVASPSPGLTVIAGGKLTTYRVMAQDAVDFALAKQPKVRPSVTAELPLLGADGYKAWVNRSRYLARRYGWDPTQVRRLLSRYGSLVGQIAALVESDASLGQVLAGPSRYLKAEVVYAAQCEGVLHLEDVMTNRLRLNHESPDAGTSVAAEIAALVAPHLGWDQARVEAEVNAYANRVRAEQAAARQLSDEAAVQARLSVADVAGPVDLG